MERAENSKLIDLTSDTESILRRDGNNAVLLRSQLMFEKKENEGGSDSWCADSVARNWLGPELPKFEMISVR